jgi:transcriptional regulator with XRE-family HTH domain
MSQTLVRVLLLQKRRMKKMNQENIAEMLGISKQAYSDIETGRTKEIKAEHKLKLMKFFEMNEDEIEQIGVPQIVHQEGNNLFSNSNNVNTIDQELLTLLKDEQQKNKELQSKILEVSKTTTESNQVLLEFIKKLISGKE